MSETETLLALPRDRVGKGSSRALRRDGRVPAVVYGSKKEPEAVSLERRVIDKVVSTGHFLNTVYELECDGNKQRVLPRDLQLHPVSDAVVHIDFLRVDANAVVTIDIPVHFTNEEESPGLARGGVLNVVRHEIEMHCRIDAMVEQIEIDLTGYEIGDSIHISNVALPDGVSPTITDRDFTIATIAAPTVDLTPAEDEEEEMPETEVIRGKGDKDEDDA
ncbi:50S ribosomal protein L25/general stress protein Ctc [Oceanibacterium hippocampi]|uniref:Large ribosomal subunit protein bL25 n=1 Tax=Oceanibacterium hippocampi TaxID=745714 RepID=A0A1Y5U1I8_9PROT|nr:50S ribosomal protein L25/general stress protein Ctc [Oceanibacterium hippocampi]SLN74529.1 50S ribosomal protein L25 [Oceanibacterium hippocampi]